MLSHRVRQAKAWREVIPARWRQGARNARIAGKNPTLRRTRKDHRLLSGNERLNLVIFFPPGGAHVVAQPKIQGQVRSGSPAILTVKAHVEAAAVRGIRLPLHKRRWRAE